VPLENYQARHNDAIPVDLQKGDVVSSHSVSRTCDVSAIRENMLLGVWGGRASKRRTCEIPTRPPLLALILLDLVAAPSPQEPDSFGIVLICPASVLS